MQAETWYQPSAQTPRRSLGKVFRLGLRYLGLAAIAGVVLFPIYLTLLYSFSGSDLTRGVLAPNPSNLTAKFYGFAWDSQLPRYMLNSAVMSIGITTAQITTSILAAYAFVFLKFPFRRTLFVVFLSTLMIPWEVTVLANYKTTADLGWLNSYQGLIVPFAATAFGTFLLRQAFLAVPGELRDAAALDGYGHMGFLWKVVVPLARPSIAALGVFSFLGAWNQYLWPLLVADKDQYRTVQIGLKALNQANIESFSTVFAGTMIAAIPIILLLIFFQKQIVRGLTAGAVKG